jgi:tRNA (guanine-N7-)-methyltransferase
LVALARRYPRTNFVGLDVARKPLIRAVNTAAESDLENISFIKADIKLLYPLLLDSSLKGVYLHYPAPRLRGRHRKHLVFDQRFLDNIYRSLEADGRLSVMTDNRELHAEMLDLVETDGRFERVDPEGYRLQIEGDLKSPTQRVWESRGMPTLRFVLRPKFNTDS